jgi:hypothetical protein
LGKRTFFKDFSFPETILTTFFLEKALDIPKSFKDFSFPETILITFFLEKSGEKELRNVFIFKTIKESAGKKDLKEFLQFLIEFLEFLIEFVQFLRTYEQPVGTDFKTL